MLPRQEEEPVGLLVAAVRRRQRQVIYAEAANLRLTPQQFWTLLALHEAGALSLGAVAERLRMDAPTASRVVATLTRRRLVRTTEDPADRRRLLLAPTPEGVALAERVHPIARELRDAIVAGFTPGELAVLRGALRKILDNLDAFERRRPARARRPTRHEEELA